MRRARPRTRFQESILYSDEDHEPYVYVSPQPTTWLDSAGFSGSCTYEREIEAAVLRRLDTYPGC